MLQFAGIGIISRRHMHNTYDKCTRGAQVFCKVKRQASRVNRLESRRTLGDKGRADLGDTVGERELEARGGELLDVGTTNVIGLLDLDNSENLFIIYGQT